MKHYRDAWAVSFLIVSFVTILLIVCNFANINLSDTLTRVLSSLDLIALSVLAFTSVKLKIWTKEKQD